MILRRGMRQFTSPAARTAGRPRVVVLGTGWGGNRFARMVDKARYDVTLVSPANHFLFTPMLPQTAVGTLEFRVVQEPVRQIEGLGHYYQAKARTLNLSERRLTCTDIFHGAQFDLDFDHLVIATGCKTNTFNTPGVEEAEGAEVFFLKHLHHARQIRNRILECFERAAMPGLEDAARERLLSFVVVGGGPTSCEFTAELYDFLKQDVAKWAYPDLYKHVKVTLVEAGPALMGAFDARLREYVERRFADRNIDVRTDTAVRAVEVDPERRTSEALLCATDGEGEETVLPFGAMVWAAGLQQIKFVENATELPKGPTGRILVDDQLRVAVGDEALDGRIYALGDCAAHSEHPLAPTAQVAEQQADYLARCFNEHYHAAGTEGAVPLPGEVRRSSFPPTPNIFYPKSRGFRYVARGAMSSMGAWKGLVDASHIDTPLGQVDAGTLKGFAAFSAWNGYYLSRQYSWANMILNPMYKLKSTLFGRDVSRF